MGKREEALTHLKEVFAMIRELIIAYMARIELAIVYGELGGGEKARAGAAEILELVPNSSADI